MKKLLLTSALFAGLAVFSVQASSPAFQVNKNAGEAVKSAAQYFRTGSQKQSQFKLNDSQILKTVALSNGNASMQVVKDADGLVYKRYVVNGKVLGDRARGVKPVLKTAAVPSYFEQFEGWNESLGEDWIPENMTEKNLPHSIKGVDGNTRNLTWCCLESGGFLMPTTTDGTKEAFIRFAYDQKDNNDSIICPAKEQDEWLITPVITPKASENLYFLAAIDNISVYNIGEGFLDWGTSKFIKREVVNTLSVLVSADDGKSWTEVWNVEKDVTSKMSDEDIIYGPFFEYAPFKVDLTAYQNKPIKIAFRYWRAAANMNGNSVCLDAILVGIPQSEAMYARPDGGFMAGFSQDWLSMNNSIMLLPAYVENQWFNASGTYADTFEWEFPDGDNPDATVTYTDADPFVGYAPNIVSSPILTASVGGQNPSTFQWGIPANEPTVKALVQYGGDMVVPGPDNVPVMIGMGNFDMFKRFTTSQFGVDNFCFGTGSSEMWGGTVDAIANFFSKPAAPYAISNLWIQAGELDADADAEFKLIVHEVDDWGYMGDTIAVSTCYANQVAETMMGGDVYYTIPFKFYKEDEFGYEVESYIEINSAVMVELTGINSPKVRKFAPFNQYENGDNGENNCYAFFLIEKEDKPGEYVRRMLAASDLLIDFNSSFLFFTDALYNWMKVDEDMFEAPVEGGSKVFDINTYYNPQPVDADYVTWWIESDDKAAMDEWVTTEFIPATQTENPKMKLTASALPEGVAGRKAAFTLATIGASAKFQVVQGDAGVKNVVASQVSARMINGELVVNYTENVSKMRIFSATGQMVGAYELPQSGRFAVDAENLAKGMYMVQFDNLQVVKFIK